MNINDLEREYDQAPLRERLVTSALAWALIAVPFLIVAGGAFAAVHYGWLR